MPDGNYNVVTMKAHLIRIGNSRGIRLPKPIIEQAGLSDEVELRVEDGAIVITGFHKPRTGWTEAARQLRETVEDDLLDEETPTRFDEAELE